MTWGMGGIQPLYMGEDMVPGKGDIGANIHLLLALAPGVWPKLTTYRKSLLVTTCLQKSLYSAQPTKTVLAETRLTRRNALIKGYYAAQSPTTPMS